jgi:hypothetical protein
MLHNKATFSHRKMPAFQFLNHAVLHEIIVDSGVENSAEGVVILKQDETLGSHIGLIKKSGEKIRRETNGYLSMTGNGRAISTRIAGKVAICHRIGEKLSADPSMARPKVRNIFSFCFCIKLSMEHM